MALRSLQSGSCWYCRQVSRRTRRCLRCSDEVSAQGYAIALADNLLSAPPPSFGEHATFLTLTFSNS